jgi:hypothetical protein
MSKVFVSVVSEHQLAVDSSVRFIDTPNCVLEDRVQYSTVLIPNVFCDDHLQIINCMIFMDPCIVDDSVEIPIRCSFVIEFIISKFIESSTCFERHTAHHQEL